MKPQGLFDEPHDCARDGHRWEKSTTTYEGETEPRLTWTCTECRIVRGRC